MRSKYGTSNLYFINRKMSEMLQREKGVSLCIIEFKYFSAQSKVRSKTNLKMQQRSILM